MFCIELTSAARQCTDDCSTCLFQRGVESRPCYDFSVPITSTSSSSILSQALPFCSLISRGGDREPGLIMVTQSGDIRFCDNATSSLGDDRMIKMSVPLGSGEYISQLHRCGVSEERYRKQRQTLH
jgi:hypothetical protein